MPTGHIKNPKMQRRLMQQQQRFQGTPAALLWPRKSREGGALVFAQQAEQKAKEKYGKSSH